MIHEITRKIRDPIHNYIQLGPLETALIDTSQFQRLRFVRQLGLNFLVYPGANHTRFEHSLGVYHLARACAQEMGLEEHHQTVISTAALLHDIGHGPFSHFSDMIFGNHGTSHEEFSLKIVREEPVCSILEEHGVPLREVCSVLEKRHRYSSLISSQLDVDKMDYLVRDGHYIGVPVGADLGRIVNTHRLVGGRVAITQTSLPAVESLLISRYIMFPSVYNHRTARIAERMLLRAFEISLEGGVGAGSCLSSLDRLEEVQQMMDTQFLLWLRESPRARSLVSDVMARRLLKTAFELPFSRIGEEQLHGLFRGGRQMARELEDALAASFGVPRERVIVDFPALSIKAEVPLQIVTGDGELRPVSEVSKLAAILGGAQFDHWSIRVFLPEKFRNQPAGDMERLFGKFFELKESPGQRSLREFDLPDGGPPKDPPEEP